MAARRRTNGPSRCSPPRRSPARSPTWPQSSRPSTPGSTCSSSSTPRPPSPSRPPSGAPADVLATADTAHDGPGVGGRRPPSREDPPVRHQRAGARRPGRHDQGPQLRRPRRRPGSTTSTCVGHGSLRRGCPRGARDDGIQRRPVERGGRRQGGGRQGRHRRGGRRPRVPHRRGRLGGKVVGLVIPGADALLEHVLGSGRPPTRTTADWLPAGSGSSPADKGRAVLGAAGFGVG